MAKAAVAAPSVELDAIDRLEQKLKQLVAVLDRTRTEHARAKTRLDEAEGTGAELAALRSEREQIRSRVDDMLKQIESLNL